MVSRRFILTFFVLICIPLSSSASTAPFVPDLLKPWQNWVLHGHEEKLVCTPSYLNPDNLQCDWPSTLELTVTEKGAEFKQIWLVQHERLIQLPGNSHNWPENIRINGQPAIVLAKNDVPKIKVPQGKFTVTGRFSWISVPEFISIPSHTAIVRLVLFDKTVDFPNFDTNGRLWLQARLEREEKVENRLSMQSFRLLDDRIPFKETIVLQLNVSGAAREVILGPVFSADGVVPVSLISPLPAQLESDGRLKVQVRPGQWNITLSTRHLEPVTSRNFSPVDDGFWPQEEIWSFRSRPNLRVVEISGVPPIDPLQTSLPESWRNYPAYRIIQGDTLFFKELKRGDPHPAPDQLSLERNIWLRFDGSGYTIQDTITGTKTTAWRLEMNPPLQLGRVAVDGREQFITRREGTDKTGVELRKGLLNLTADSLYQGKISLVPATGWDHDFQQVRARLFLPPGWRLINASGIDTIYGTWVKRWTLLDFFVVLIFTIAVIRLYSYPLGGLAFTSLILMYHEPDAPRLIWLAILVGVAVLRYLPEGKLRTTVKIYQFMTLILLIATVIPFSIQQLRTGIYPQLEKPAHAMYRPSPAGSAVPAKQTEYQQAQPEEIMMDMSVTPKSVRRDGGILSKVDEIRPERYRSSLSGYDVAQYDPAMINQTGPGLPDWQWNTFTMDWSGPVQKDQKISFLFTGPVTNLILSFTRVILVLFLILGLLNIRFRKGKGFSYPSIKLLLLLSFLLPSFLAPAPLQAGEIPSPQILAELQKRLLEPEDCFPGCADISSMDINITADRLQISMIAEVQTATYFPLPGNGKHWLPGKVTIDEHNVVGLFRAREQLLMLVPRGNHRIILSGKLPNRSSLQLSLPMKPRRVTSTADGWTVEGIHENGIVDNQIQFKRIIKEQGVENKILETGILPPFLLIERTLHLGLTWKIETTFKRISPVGSAVVFDFPLLPGESILTENIRTKDNMVQVNMNAAQTFLQLSSVIDKTDHIKLKHPETTLWTEIWRVDASPVFHLATSGIPVILHQQGNRWYPTWHPWPGEEVDLTITRPAGVEGQTLTIEKSHLEIHPGRRATDTTLELTVRSSRGGQHSIVLPEGSLLQEVRIDGTVQPVRQEKRLVHLPVKPGLQEFQLTWRNTTGITAMYRTPAVDIGTENVNANIDVHLPRNRWPLFTGGPLMGPAVLFWSVVLILLLVTFGLSRTGLTPLRFHQWFLLGIGMSQSNIAASLLVVGWLIAFDLRGKAKPNMAKTTFNLMQIGLGFLTILAIGSFITAISMGLLGHPDMNIAGNGSHSGLFRWYQDQSGSILPQAWVFSIPMFIYRLAMLAWALWISFSLINLLKWGWHNFSEPTLWHKIPRKPKTRIPKRRKAQTSDNDKQK